MLSVIQRELYILAHERKMVLFVLLFAASAYALLIGNLYHGQIVQNIPVAVCDLDDSALSHEFIKNVAEADQYELIQTVGDEDEAVNLLKKHQAAAVIIIPADFSQQFYQGKNPVLAFWEDGTNTLAAGYAASPMQALWSAWLLKFRQQAAIAAGTPDVSPATLAISLRYIANPVQGYLCFYIYGIMLIAAQIGLLISYSLSVQSDARKGYYKKHGVLKTMLAKSLLYWFFSMLAVLLGCILLSGLFSLPFNGNTWEMMLLIGAFLFAVQNIAGLTGIYFKTKLALIQAMVFYSLPAFMLFGYIWPNQGMLPVINWLSLLQPAHYVLSDVREIALTGMTNAAYESHLLILIIIGACCFMAACYLLKSNYPREKHPKNLFCNNLS